MQTMEKKVVFITGGNQEIGYETALNLLRYSSTYHVIIGSRQVSNGEAAVSKLKAEPGSQGTVTTVQLDVTDDRSVDAAAQQVSRTYGRLDVLVNNAASILLTASPSREVCRQVLNTNVVGALSMTEACLDLLRKSAEPRVVFVSSGTGSLTWAADPKSLYHSDMMGHRGFEYRTSKAAMSMLVVLYWNRLKGEGFKVIGSDPGPCATNFTGDPQSLLDLGAFTPAQGGERVAAAVKGDKDADLGRVIADTGDVQPW